MSIKASDIRQQFIDFFESKNHEFIRSSSVVPNDDPTLLFTNAGMNQFKPYFIGLQKPVNKRAVNSQKCIRVSGKHNDLEEVGVDNYHHTFFEMLGNWSFGDFYKKEAISWAWELLTDVWKLDKNRLWVTIYHDDEETGELWKEHSDIDPHRILKFGAKDNFWEMGETGPCGPCTEIHYYTGENTALQVAEGVNAFPEYREIWNLVFIQYNRDKKGKLNLLPQKHVDTGAGFERLVAILNGKSSNYETDLFIPILNDIIKISGKDLTFEDGVPHRVIADHLRMLAFSIADGAMPGSDGRGYVLRRILRRAARFGRKLEMKEPFVYKLINTLCEVMGKAFPELIEKKSHLEKVIEAEEKSFNDTLDRGLDVFDKVLNKIPKNGIISGEDVFKLYDTYGFPVDLTELLARENSINIDVEGFNECMVEQKKRARNSGKFQVDIDNSDWIIVDNKNSTEFLGYEQLEANAKIVKYIKSKNSYKIVLDRTPFYAESGGQVGDRGTIKSSDYNLIVEDVQKNGDEFIHLCTIDSGNLTKNYDVLARVDSINRQKIKLNHTSTHLLHQALKEVIGNHVQQAGSLVSAEMLRFDLTHYSQITKNQLIEVENRVNSIILQNIALETNLKSYKEAQKDGAVSLFGEKYGDIVRVVDVPGFSKELCGGTHVNRTGDIGSMKIISESALSSGVRRLIAVSGGAVQNILFKNNEILLDLKNQLKCRENEISSRLKSILKDKKILEKENELLKQNSIKEDISYYIKNSEDLGVCRLVVENLKYTGDLINLGDYFRNAFKVKGISLIGILQGNKPMVMCAVTDDLTHIVKAGSIVKEIGIIMGGGGGGKSHIATAGGSDPDLLKKAVEHGRNLIIELLGKYNG